MNIDKNLLNQLAKMDDRSLTAAIRMFASSSGVQLPEKLDKASLDALRSALGSATDEDVLNAKKIFEGYKNNERT